MQTLTVKKISAGTIYKLCAIGFSSGFAIIFLIFSILAAFGMETLEWGDQHITGVKALLFGPLMGLLMALIFTAIVGSIIAFGLWVYSFFKGINIEYTIE